jgi:hypothetical protein
MADAVGSVCVALDPLLRLIEAHVMAAERLHADDTTVPVLAKGKTDTGRCWMSGTTGLLAGRDRQRRCSTTRAIAKVSIPRHIWPGMTAIRQALPEQ